MVVGTVASRTRERADYARLLLCGDVMTGRGLDQVLPSPVDPQLRETYMQSALGYVELAERANGPISRPMRPADVWGDALDEWRLISPDIRLINLETAVTRASTFAPKGINYRMSPENLACLTAAGVDVCTLANNHVLDFGPRGLAETMASLTAVGIHHAGAGADISEAESVLVRPLPGRDSRLLFIAAAFEDSGVPPSWRAGQQRPGVNLVEPTAAAARDLTARLREVRRPGDVAVVSLHWGSNWGYQVPEPHRRFAHALLDEGAVSIVHGHSSHHPRPIELYRGRLILYGCGDLLNDYEGIQGYEAFRSGLVAAYVVDVAPDGSLVHLELTPFAIRRFRLSRPAPADVRWLGERISRESHAFGVTLAATASGRLRAHRVKPEPGPR